MAGHVEETAIRSTETPFPPSWIDRLIQWIDHLPGPAWLTYVLGMVATAFLINVILWLDGSVPYGSAGYIYSVFPPLHFYPLMLYHYLTRISSRSLQSFRPLLDVDDAEFAQIDYELATLPRRLGWLHILIGIGLAVFLTISDPESFGELVPKTALPYVPVIVANGFAAAAFLCLVARSLRQLRMVRQLHARATNLNLLKLEPAHAFSTLTARSGIGAILLLILGYAYALVVNPSAFGTIGDLTGYAVTMLFAVIVFLVPVMGLRDRIEEEKQRALNETSDLLQSATDDLHTKASRRAYDEVGGIENTISALMRERDLLGKISTWPWDPRTIRGFVSTLLLPIFLWLVTRLLERFV